MFDETIVLQSAVSAFNNSALRAPAFLWYGVLVFPLFVMVYMCGKSFLDRFRNVRENILKYVAVCAVVLAFAWWLFFVGDYGVLRDKVSVLPFLSAGILFLISFYLSGAINDVVSFKWSTFSRKQRLIYALVCVCVLVGVGMLDVHAWWGPLLQLCMFLFGIVLGRHMTKQLPVVSGCVGIMFLCVVALIMQPELFRFGQLGNLTIGHMLGVVIFGMCAVATFVLENVVASGRISNGVFNKLKWLIRLALLLGIALFLLTEAVPVLLGIVCIACIMFAISVLHAKSIPNTVPKRVFALTLGVFGLLTVMPAVTALGILYWVSLPDSCFWSDARFLL